MAKKTWPYWGELGEEEEKIRVFGFFNREMWDGGGVDESAHALLEAI